MNIRRLAGRWTSVYCSRLVVLAACLRFSTLPAAVIETDVCVYGGTAAGVAAAVQATRMGKTAAIAEFGKHLGGMTSGGLGATDIGNKAAIGGISREFYQRVGKHYGTHEQWTFEPHVAENIFNEMIRESKVQAHLEQRLVSVQKDGALIEQIAMENGNVYRARMFIDATYEGDLMAKAKVSCTVGREANAKYNETLDGVRAETPKHQFTVPVDPYVKPGVPSSGLLTFIQRGDGGRPGEGDRSVQAYNFRLCFTTNEANRMKIEPPRNYAPANYEVLARYLEALAAAGRNPKLSEFWNPIWMPNGKTDINNNGGFSTDFIGANYDYPEADYQTRERIWKEHEDYARGFLIFLATSPRVPVDLRAEMQTWGPCKDEFPDTGGWPYALYVREARRMISDYVMTEHNCRGTTIAQDSVGLGAYGMDSHNCQRIVKNGRVENEGDVQVHGFAPYPISYRSLIPKAGECENLLVPVCLSASHIAYGSIRMEPVFMLLGQSAATAASFAIDEQISIQKVSYEKLRARLLVDKQVLEWKPPANIKN
jgi:FAD dependent oxidoreductase